MPRIFDNIDLHLLTALRDEELDFIINYDIKYRLGRDAESDEA